MRRFSPLLAVTLFSLFAAQPLLVNQLTCSDDSAFHIGRAIALEQLIDSGHFFPRWSPVMAHGYGYPFFNYYGPLSSYLLVTLHKLGFIYPAAFHIALFLSLWLAALATYAFAHEWWGDMGGVVSAVLYLTSPYFAYDLLFRGNLAESFAFLWPPLILLTLHRAFSSPLPARAKMRIKVNLYSILAALTFAGLLLTHNTTALASAPLAAGYIILMAYLQRDHHTLIRGSIALLFGFALAAYFWLPAIAETGLIQTDKLLVPPIFTYYTNFLSIGELLAPPSIIDPHLLNPSPAKALGLTAALLALAGFLSLVYHYLTARRSFHSSVSTTRQPSRIIQNTQLGSWNLGFGFFVLVCLIVYTLFTLPIAKPAWDFLPLVKFIQFPWRLLAPATLCAAILAGAIVQNGAGLLKAPFIVNSQPWVATALCLAAILGHLSWWYPRYCAPFEELTVGDLVQYELDTGTLGTTAKGEFLPRTVRFMPDNKLVAQALIRGEQPQYLTGLPPDSSLATSGPDPLNYHATVTLSKPAALTFNQFFFPGWQASIDGQPVEIAPLTNTGLVTFNVPTGEHTLRIYFGNTPVRAAGIAISLVSFTAVCAYGVWLFANRKSPVYDIQSPVSDLQSINAKQTITNYPVLITALSLIIIRPLLIDRMSNPLQHSAFDGHMLTTGQPVNATLAGSLTVLSAEYPPSVASGGDFDVSLYLTAREHTEQQYRPRFDLTSPDGLVWNNGNDALPPRWHKEPPETPQWPQGQYAQWSRRSTVLPGTPPGDYHLSVVVFDRATLQPNSRVDENGNAISPLVVLGTVRVARPVSPPPINSLGIQYRVDRDFGPLTLLGYNLDRSEARPGDTVLITLFLRADELMNSDLKFNLLNPDYPTSEWQPDDIWRFQVSQRIPAEAASGPFQFSLGLTDDNSPELNLAPIQLTAPDRLFTRPPIASSTAIRFGDSIELSGYEIQINNDQILITLGWHALATPDSDLLAFIHIEDASGRIVAQSDAVPADWSRPTTGWIDGEYILDLRTLPNLPPGTYNIFVGFADRITGARMPTENGDRALIGVYKAP